MILPVGAKSFAEAMRMGSEIYHHLKVNSKCTIRLVDFLVSYTLALVI